MSNRRSSPASSLGDSPSLFESAYPSDSSLLDDLGDTFPGASPRSAIAVSTLTQTAKDVLEGAFVPLWVRGEISDFKAHRNGHWYFCLRDRNAQLKCVVWSRDQRGMPAAPDDGMQVNALGQLGVYAARGDMQFSIKRLEAEGEGLWRKAFEVARARLESDGLLAPERKRPLPRHPRKIAFVTSTSGAALRDVVAVLRRRAPGIELIVVHAAVQGDSAPAELCAALKKVARWGGADLVIVGRGGGSREDLWAFNHERVARAVAACPVPTISAVGHEIDFSLCDLVADFRAATPSAAAEVAATSSEQTVHALVSLRRRLASAAQLRVDRPKLRAQSAARAIAAATTAQLNERRHRMVSLTGKLQALSPLATLERGYSVAQSAEQKALTSVGDFTAGMPFTVRLRDGEVDAVTRHVRPSVADR